MRRNVPWKPFVAEGLAAASAIETSGRLARRRPNDRPTEDRGFGRIQVTDALRAGP